LLYTDGLSEARDRNGVFYPLTTRAPGLREIGPEALLDGIATDLRAHTGKPLDDDLAMVAVERLTEAQRVVEPV
jgi:serine phosphatase RsbU (regulator of sigma subunit)